MEALIRTNITSHHVRIGPILREVLAVLAEEGLGKAAAMAGVGAEVQSLPPTLGNTSTASICQRKEASQEAFNTQER
jgi:hypothetical protein